MVILYNMRWTRTACRRSRSRSCTSRWPAGRAAPAAGAQDPDPPPPREPVASVNIIHIPCPKTRILKVWSNIYIIYIYIRVLVN